MLDVPTAMLLAALGQRRLLADARLDGATSQPSRLSLREHLLRRANGRPVRRLTLRPPSVPARAIWS